MDERQTDQLGQRLKSISADMKRYIEKRIELFMLNTGEHVSRWMAEAMQKGVGMLLLAMAVLFLLIALAIYTGDLVGSRSLGYVVVALPMLIAGSLFYALKPKAMVRRLQNSFESELLKLIADEREKESKSLNLPEPENEQETA